MINHGGYYVIKMESDVLTKYLIFMLEENGAGAIIHFLQRFWNGLIRFTQSSLYL